LKPPDGARKEIKLGGGFVTVEVDGEGEAEVVAVHGEP
jgi:hypothetical protein